MHLLDSLERENAKCWAIAKLIYDLCTYFVSSAEDCSNKLQNKTNIGEEKENSALSHQSNNERLQFEPQQSKENTINCSIYWMKWTRLGWGEGPFSCMGLMMKRKNLWNWIKISRKRWSSHSSGAGRQQLSQWEQSVSKSRLQCSSSSLC